MAIIVGLHDVADLLSEVIEEWPELKIAGSPLATAPSSIRPNWRRI
jgi:hypothetical protein